MAKIASDGGKNDDDDDDELILVIAIAILISDSIINELASNKLLTFT